MRPTALISADDAAQFGGKAAQLCQALRAKLPVPGGYALSVEQTEAIGAARQALDLEAGHWAVRSSAVGEDSTSASFAGQHLSLLNIPTDGLSAAVAEVWRSASSAAALAYRQRLGIDGEPKMAVVIQRVVAAKVAGVLFTRDPISGERLRVIEAAWGLGEVVVGGELIPDTYRLSTAGKVIERRVGVKDVRIDLAPNGGTQRSAIANGEARALCLDLTKLQALHELALQVEAAFESDSGDDLEWAFDDSPAPYLLQRRAITR